LDRTAQLEYDFVVEMTAAEYQELLLAGWRRFGHSVFRPQCASCQACESLRVDVAQFAPNRSQRRVRKLNEGRVKCRIGEPSATRSKLRLYDAFHAYQSYMKGWPEFPPKDRDSFVESFVNNPFPTQEWCYFLDEELVGVGYVDALPDGLSAIYFVHDPDHRDRSLGIWNVLSIIDYAQSQRLPFVYLGYYVEGSPSMAYKATFRPSEVLTPAGQWVPFRERSTA
jgi:arginine-tRNA-protein transferase